MDLRNLTNDPIEDLVELAAGGSTLGLSLLQGRGLGGLALNALGAGVGSAAGLALTNGKSNTTRAIGGIGGGLLGHLLANYATDLFLETPRERELRLKGLEYAAQQQAAQQQSNQPIN
jgi:hypothetical protein